MCISKLANWISLPYSLGSELLVILFHYAALPVLRGSGVSSNLDRGLTASFHCCADYQSEWKYWGVRILRLAQEIAYGERLRYSFRLTILDNLHQRGIEMTVVVRIHDQQGDVGYMTKLRLPLVGDDPSVATHLYARRSKWIMYKHADWLLWHL